jgi:hypothetical protein
MLHDPIWLIGVNSKDAKKGHKKPHRTGGWYWQMMPWMMT